MKFRNWMEKMEILKKRKELKGTDIWIKNDLTRREDEVQKWLDGVAERERRSG